MRHLAQRRRRSQQGPGHRLLDRRRHALSDPATLGSATRDELFRRLDIGTPHHPHYVVWELTLACDQHCTHCGSRAGEARPHELSTGEALDVVKQLAAMKTWEVTLIGGEAYLHPGFLEIIRALRSHGIRPTLTTGGLGITPRLAQAMHEAGLHSASVSIDGLERTHDLFRGLKGSFQKALGALRTLRAAGIRVAANTNFHRLNLEQLDPLYELLRDHGIEAWLLILTVPLGRAADRPEMLLQPWELLTLMPALARLKERGFADNITLVASNTIGYFGPEETLLRSPRKGMTDHFHGCIAGRFTLGIEADGAVKGCPSLQTSHYVGGKLTEQPLAMLWDTPRLAFNRARTVDELWGFCRTCPFAATCLGGCTFTSHAHFGRPGNNPLCHYRARVFASRGERERLVLREAAPGAPFDNGHFEIVVEPFDAPDPRPPTPKAHLMRKRTAT